MEITCSFCAGSFDPDDYRFNVPTAKLAWEIPQTHGRRVIAQKCGFTSDNKPLCVRCCTLLSNYLADQEVDPSETAGDMWLTARLRTLVNQTANPGTRERENARKRSARQKAKERISELETELDIFTWENCPYDMFGEPYDDEAEYAVFDHSWRPMYDEIIELCGRYRMISRYYKDWAPEDDWEAYVSECLDTQKEVLSLRENGKSDKDIANKFHIDLDDVERFAQLATDWRSELATSF
jgi:hypothetical protein